MLVNLVKKLVKDLLILMLGQKEMNLNLSQLDQHKKYNNANLFHQLAKVAKSLSVWKMVVS
jgi:hypothetical protein